MVSLGKLGNSQWSRRSCVPCVFSLTCCASNGELTDTTTTLYISAKLRGLPLPSTAIAPKMEATSFSNDFVVSSSTSPRTPRIKVCCCCALASASRVCRSWKKFASERYPRVRRTEFTFRWGFLKMCLFWLIGC